MFQVRDYSVFLPSPNAERQFRKLRRLDFVVNSLLALLIALSIWNIATLVQMRLISNQDLADVRSITDDLSTHLIWILTLVTLGVILLREWLVGERTVGIVYPLTALLAIGLVPAAMSEIQPALQDQTLRVVMNECPPKAIVNNTLSSIGRCVPREIREGDVLLAVTDPTEGDIKTLDPVSGGQNTIAFTMSGRGTYTVYFMFRFEDVSACTNGMIFPRGMAANEANYQCVNYDGAAWMVMPHTTASNQPSGVHLIQVAMP